MEQRNTALIQADIDLEMQERVNAISLAEASTALQDLHRSNGVSCRAR